MADVMGSTAALSYPSGDEISECAFPPVPSEWKESCVHTECTFHQLSPYIGKLKSSIANHLIREFSAPGDLVVDPFSGSGTIPLEASLLGRRSFAADISPYADLLTRAKLHPPPSLEAALLAAENMIIKSEKFRAPNPKKVPKWVSDFFHPQTLNAAINFSRACKEDGDVFLQACFLGILHHQRPGFLSYPSSHLIPYLRGNKYPRNEYPEMYEYRELAPRLLNKIKRIYKRPRMGNISTSTEFHHLPVEQLIFPERFHCLLTSPPYMNALDYGRDNRLRLWFINPEDPKAIDTKYTKQKTSFISAITSLAGKLETNLCVDGHAIFVVGENVARGFEGHPSHDIRKQVTKSAPSLKIIEVMTDTIPDIRRARRECRGIKTEHVLVFKKIY